MNKVEEVLIAKFRAGKRSRNNDKRETYGADPLHYWLPIFLKTGSGLCILPLQITLGPSNNVGQCFRLEWWTDLPPSKQLRRKLFLFHFQFVYASLDLLYLAFYAQPRVKLEQVGEKEYMDFHIHFLSRLAAFLILVWTVWGAPLFLRFFAEMIRLRHLYIGRCSGNRFLSDVSSASKELDKCLQIVVGLVVVMAHVQPLLPTVLHLTARHSLRYWPSVFLPQRIYDNFVTVVFYAALDLSLSYFSVFGGLLLGLSIPLALTLSNHWVGLISQKFRVGKRDLNCPLWLLFRMYREQQVFNGMTNSIFGSEVIPVLAFGGAAIFIVDSVAIAHKFRENGNGDQQNSLSGTALANYGLGVIALSVGFHYLFQSGGSLWSVSRNVLWGDKGFCGRKKEMTGYQKKVLASLKELRVYMGSILFFTNFTFLWFMGNVLDKSVTLLIATSIA